MQRSGNFWKLNYCLNYLSLYTLRPISLRSHKIVMFLKFIHVKVVLVGFKILYEKCMFQLVLKKQGKRALKHERMSFLSNYLNIFCEHIRIQSCETAI